MFKVKQLQGRSEKSVLGGGCFGSFGAEPRTGVHYIQIIYITSCCCCCCCCCRAYLSSCYRTASDTNLLDDPRTFHYNDYFLIGGIRTCLGVSDDPMFLWISSNSCPLTLLLFQSHQAEIIIVKRLIQGRNNVTSAG